MEFFLIIIIIILVYLLLRKKSSNNLKEDLTKDVKTYGKAFRQAGTTFMDTIKEKDENGIEASQNLFVNNMLNPKYVIDPNTDDDEDFIKSIEKYNTKDKLKAWGPFYDGAYDKTQAYKTMPFKMYWVFIEISKDAMTKILDFNLSQNNVSKTSKHEKLLNADKLCIYANVYKTKKNPTRWVGEVDLMFGDSKIYAGSIGSDNQKGFWDKLELFMKQKMELEEDFVNAYNDNG